MILLEYEEKNPTKTEKKPTHHKKTPPELHSQYRLPVTDIFFF